MDYGDIVRLIFFGVIILSFLSGVFGKSDGEKKAQRRPKPKPARPTQLSESGGQQRPRAPLVPARPELVEPEKATPIFADAGVARAEERRRETLERDVRDTERTLLEHDITDLPTIAEELDPERRPRRRQRQQEQRRQRYVEGGDVLRSSLRDPATLERAFIVKEVLDRPLALRDER